MKRFLKSAGLPIGVFALAIGSAFATNAMKNNALTVPAYQQIDSKGVTCTPRIASCDINGSEACTWEEAPSLQHNLYGMEFDEELNQTVCTLRLYKTE
ncbi:DUF6520 family protein [Myroides profundi]|uniref:Uncharacterized protein n=1 Tax=Myroides profundi TaxID=480520 RepID=A0AAJ4W6U1_MYRPR|nr:DUF6520 family protein [Myroides profundi]AJH14482.1 hypothetical protein MPR_1300 [Myroides profundi]SER58520.1 hypothetical protein SAMN04488089_12026 [Myroides profundi]